MELRRHLEQNPNSYAGWLCVLICGRARTHTNTHTRRRARLTAEGLPFARRVIPVIETIFLELGHFVHSWPPSAAVAVMRSNQGINLCFDNDVATAPHMLSVTGELVSYMVKE